MPANNILPEVGASTWALGNQKCIINIGVFTKNNINIKKQKSGENFIKDINQNSKLITINIKGKEKKPV